MTTPTAAHSPLRARLDVWIERGFVTAEQAHQIAEFEAAEAHRAAMGRPARAIALLGALTLVSGLGSIVAYNWDGISPALKLIGMGVVLLGALAFVATARPAPSAVGGAPRFEVAAIVSSGASLASLALVSQIYEQGGDLWQLLAFWCVLVSPGLWLTRSRFSSTYLFVALAGTLLSATSAIDDGVERLTTGTDSELVTALVMFGLAASAAAVFLRSEIPGRRKTGAVFFHLLLVGLGAFGSLTSLADVGPQPVLLGVAALTLAAVIPLLRGEGARELGLGSWKHVAGLFSLGLLLSVLPPSVVELESQVLAFSLFVAFWGAYFWVAERSGSENGVRLSVLALGIRVVIASFELFENLLVTGTVLVGLGVTALVLTRRRLGGGAAT